MKSGGDWRQINVTNAISLYIVHGITEVSAVLLVSTAFGNMIGW